MGRSVLSKGRLYLVGLGLIGGSVARGLQSTGWEVVGWDRNQEVLDAARDSNVFNSLQPPDDPPDCDLVMLAVPVPAMVSVAKKIVQGLVVEPVWTDVGSTKYWITDQLRSVLPEDQTFVGGHPMAGSEESGFRAGDPLLFENAICVLTGDENKPAFRSVRSLWDALGAHIVTMKPRVHDQVVANVSHLPHLVAAGLLTNLDRLNSGNQQRAQALAAGGFRDVTRVADGEPELWRDILQTNRPQVVEALEGYRDELRTLEKLINRRDWDELTSWLRRARSLREEIPERTKGLIGPLHEIRVQAPDQPGVLASITGILAEYDLNIRDLEVLRVREGEMGTVRLAFRDRETQDKARELLEQSEEGFSVI